MKKPISLFVAADPPMPPTGGGNRAYHLLWAFSEVTSCTLINLFSIPTKRLPYEIRQQCISIISAEESNVKSSHWFKYLPEKIKVLINPSGLSKEDLIEQANYYASNTPKSKSFIRKYFYKLLRKRLINAALRVYQNGYTLPARTLERQKQFHMLENEIKFKTFESDIIWVDFSYILPLFNKIKKEFISKKIICNAHNVEYSLLEMQAHIAKDKLLKVWLELQARIMKKAEMEGFELCDLVFTCSESDKQKIKHYLPDLNIVVIPNGVNLDYFVSDNTSPTNFEILFTGTMNYAPNRDAVYFFIDKIFPLIRAQIPNCCFVVAGAKAETLFDPGSFPEGVKIIDSPSDMRPAYNSAHVVVVPLRTGSGTRLKILEAMAMLKPIVTTSIGMEGIEADEGEHIMLADDPVIFSKKVLELFTNTKLREKITQSAYQLVSEKYDWKSLREKTITSIERNIF